MDKVRIGDVVTAAPDGWTDGVVVSTAVARGQYQNAVVRWPNGTTQQFEWLDLAVLRRPVQVGDTLRNDDGTTHGPVDASDLRFMAINGACAPGWRHADGTAIEPAPRPRAKVTLHEGAPPTWEQYRTATTIPRSSFVPVEWSIDSVPRHAHPICQVCGFGMLFGESVNMYDECCALHFFGEGTEAHKHMQARAQRTNRAPAKIVGHTRDGRLVLGPGSPDPSDAERVAYWARIGRNEALAESRSPSSREKLAPDLVTIGKTTISTVLTPEQTVEAIKGAFDRAILTTGERREVTDVVAKIAADALTGRPTVERLARGLFETDDDVTEHVRRVSEFRVKGCTTKEMQAAILRRDATTQRCWDRGHAGESPEWKWYVRATDRAKSLHAALGGGK